MLHIGKNDGFERRYMEKFRVFASQFGEFVKYEHDRGARDIGLHLTHKLKSGQEQMSSALCWFQMKGIMASTLSKTEFENQDSISISLEVKHLKYWYLQPMPTYLVVYIESVDDFFILNIQKYIEKNWGKEILRLEQKNATIHLSTISKLDHEAFRKILIMSDVEEWKKVLESNGNNVWFCRRDYNFIWDLGTAESRHVKHFTLFREWLTKCRGELYVIEQSVQEEVEPKILREHWQHFMTWDDIETQYPYAEFYALENIEAEESFRYSKNYEYDKTTKKILSNGDLVYGKNFFDECIEYYLGIRLNELGKEMFSWIETLISVGLLEITSGQHEYISIAPWHLREV